MKHKIMLEPWQYLGAAAGAGIWAFGNILGYYERKHELKSIAEQKGLKGVLEEIRSYKEFESEKPKFRVALEYIIGWGEKLANKKIENTYSLKKRKKGKSQATS